MVRLTLAIVALSLCLAPLSARAAAQVENPAYKNWAQFKVGSWAQLETSMQMKGEGMPAMPMGGMKVTMKLVELTAEKAVVESSMTMNMGGQSRTMPGQRQVIAAKVDADKVDETGLPQDRGVKTDMKKGEGELNVLGKTLKCQWYDFTIKHEGGTSKMKVWTNATIPGGLVQSETNMDQGTMTMKLTGYEVAK